MLRLVNAQTGSLGGRRATAVLQGSLALSGCIMQSWREVTPACDGKMRSDRIEDGSDGKEQGARRRHGADRTGLRKGLDHADGRPLRRRTDRGDLVGLPRP